MRWLLALDSPEVKALETIQDYDASVSLIAEVDHLMHERFVFDEDAAVTTAPSPTSPTRTPESALRTQIPIRIKILKIF